MIIFEKLRFKNLLSTGNFFTEIQLNRSPNTLIVGQNGSGKSTFLDALCFGLFGKPFRKINKPQLINSINGKDCVVEIELSIGNKKYKIVRGIKPNIFEIYCDGVLVNQDAKVKDYQEHLEKIILKLNYKSFTQVVILGSASFVPFMQLSPSDRRVIIEDLLDIEIFSSMNLLVKQKLVELKDSIGDSKTKMELLAEKIQMQKDNIELHKKNNDEEIIKKRQEIGTNEKLIEKLTSDMVLIQKHILNLTQSIADEKQVQTKSSKLIQLETKLETKYKRLEKDIEFYADNDNCPTCKQGLEEHFKHSKIEEHESAKTEVKNGIDELNLEIQKVNDRLNEIIQVQNKISEHNLELAKHNATVTSINKYIKKLNEEISELEGKKSTLGDNEYLQQLKTELATVVDEHKEHINSRHYYEYASSLLKDSGIKTKIIKQYLPIMNKLINKYLTSMNFFVNFNINESFEETIKSRFRDDFSYYNFSEGEKFRIDVALLLTWRQIARMKNSVNTNLLILDEVFDSSLDTGGTDEFMRLIYDLGHDTNVFVISHKGDQLFDKFRSVIRFQKKNNFSEIAKG
jgi:DNA repair exonuclease SbcCD ATPase subunit